MNNGNTKRNFFEAKKACDFEGDFFFFYKKRGPPIMEDLLFISGSVYLHHSKYWLNKGVCSSTIIAFNSSNSSPVAVLTKLSPSFNSPDSPSVSIPLETKIPSAAAFWNNSLNNTGFQFLFFVFFYFLI